MTYKIEENNNISIVHLNGEIDMEVADKARQTILPLIKEGKTIQINLSKVDYMDSSGISVLIESKQQGIISSTDLTLLSSYGTIKIGYNILKFNLQNLPEKYINEDDIVKLVNNVKKLKNNFLGKNFVFDERRGERISDDIVSNCHQCGKPCDTHVNCSNEACHLLFIQCEKCYKELDGCCSNSCKDICALPIDKQKKIRKGYKNKTRFFKKGRLSERV